MSTTEASAAGATPTPVAGTLGSRLEVVVVPVSDVDHQPFTSFDHPHGDRWLLPETSPPVRRTGSRSGMPPPPESFHHTHPSDERQASHAG